MVDTRCLYNSPVYIRVSWLSDWLYLFSQKECWELCVRLYSNKPRSTRYSYLLWNIWFFSILESALELQNYTIYTHIFSIIMLYIVPLYYVLSWIDDKDFLSIIQHDLRNLSSSSFLFPNLCSFRRSVMSRFITRYLVGDNTSLIIVWVFSTFFIYKLTKVIFFLFIDFRHSACYITLLM